jgi:hypothetical protein
LSALRYADPGAVRARLNAGCACKRLQRDEASESGPHAGRRRQVPPSADVEGVRRVLRRHQVSRMHACTHIRVYVCVRMCSCESLPPYLRVSGSYVLAMESVYFAVLVYVSVAFGVVDSVPRTSTNAYSKIECVYPLHPPATALPMCFFICLLNAPTCVCLAHILALYQ